MKICEILLGILVIIAKLIEIYVLGDCVPVVFNSVKNENLLQHNRPCEKYFFQKNKIFCALQCERYSVCFHMYQSKTERKCILCIGESITAEERLELTPHNGPVPSGFNLLERLDTSNDCESSPCLNGGTCLDGNYKYECLCTIRTRGMNCETLLHKDCAELYLSGQTSSGVYTIYTVTNDNQVDPVSLYCDMESSGGGWTVFQRRFDGSLQFSKPWIQYKNGFGNVNGEHWLGNKYLNLMTDFSLTGVKYKLRIELSAFDGTKAYAEYLDFTVGDEGTFYKLRIGTFSGNATDGGQGFSYYNNMKFSTYDKDNDKSPGSCSLSVGGNSGNWFNNCRHANINGLYKQSPVTGQKVLFWFGWRGREALKKTTLMFRPVNFP